MKAGVVQRVFRDHFRRIERSQLLDERSRRAALNILTCRTPAQGYHVDACPNGDYRVHLYNSCKHRACPMCGALETERWLRRRRAQELRCAHHQVVFTSPGELRRLWRWNRKLFTNLYFRAAWHTLRALLADAYWLGALPGAIGVFQSWGDELQEHLHLHFILTCGGLGPNGRWIEGNRDFLLPTGVLAAKFRGKFLAYLRQAFDARTPRGKDKAPEQIMIVPPGMSRQQCFNLLNKLGRCKWHVQIEPAYGQADGIFKYVGRYIRRGPLSEKRIRSYDGHRLVIAYAHRRKHSRPTFSLPAERFVMRLLSHAPQSGTHCARAYGLYHARCIERLNQARSQLGQPPYDPQTKLPDTHELLHAMFPDFTADLCPLCGARLVTVDVVRPGRAPPQREAA